MEFDQLCSDILSAARAKRIRITTAESCTGGLVAAELTSIAGSSDVFERGFVTYSNAAKQTMLGVTTQSLDQFGAVSPEVALEMASGARARSEANLVVSVTGIAGPGGSQFKPEGRVCFGLSGQTLETRSETVEFGPQGRALVRRAATEHALRLLSTAIASM